MLYSREQIEKDPSLIYKDNPYVTFDKLIRINHDPHPYVIGSEHVAHASDNYNGILDERTTETLTCAMKGCTLTAKEHTSNLVMAVECNSDFDPDNEEHAKVVTEVLKYAAKHTEDGAIDGFIMVKE